VDVESVMVLPVSFGLHAATASKGGDYGEALHLRSPQEWGGPVVSNPWSAHALVPGIGARKATYTAHHVKTSPGGQVVRYHMGSAFTPDSPPARQTCRVPPDDSLR